MASPTQPLDVDAVRRRTLDALDRTAALAAEFELPRPPDALDRYRATLREGRYTVLVAGEAKRGKSTFVNAILGRPLLPTDVDVATCQVFRVRQADVEAYRVRFEDGSARDIAAADLPRYGSQVEADAGDAPRLDQAVRWIEVEGPVRFLPREITLLDTPGLGSLYAGHARVTGQFVPQADAVVFVLGSDSPVGREEVRFLGEILGVTRSVFLIQTAIDRYTREHWQAVQARNRQILAGEFGDRLPDPRVWPVSSTSLLKSARTADPDYEAVSKFRPLAQALHRFLFRAAGWGRAAEAVVVAHEYQRAAAAVLAGRQKSLADESNAERAARQAEIGDRRRKFEADWGPLGRSRKTLLDAVGRAAQIGRQDFRQTLAPGGHLYEECLARVQALGSRAEAEEFGRRVGGEVARDVAAAWRAVCSRATGQCAAALAPFLASADEVQSPGDAAPDTPLVRTGDVRLESDRYGLLQTSIREGGFALTTVATGAVIATQLSATLAVSAVFPPVAVVAALGAGIYGVVRGVQIASGRELQQAKNQLAAHVRELFTRVHRYYFHVDQGAGRYARADEFFDRLVADVTAHVERVAGQKSTEAGAELRRLEDEARLDDRQRRDRAAEAARRAAAWSQLAADTSRLVAELAHMEQAFKAEAAGDPSTTTTL